MEVHSFFVKISQKSQENTDYGNGFLGKCAIWVFSVTGKLHLEGAQLVGENGVPAVLHGVSLPRKIRTTLLYPFFYLLAFPLQIRALFSKNVLWDEIPHSSACRPDLTET